MQKYYPHIIFILLLKLLLIVLLPITGDEAYFVVWANHLDIGFYDHPPMVGWLIWLKSFISDDIIFFRLFSFASVILASYLIYKILLEFDIEKNNAKFTALLYIIMPIDILILLITNDVVLFIFALIGTYFLVKSLNSNWLLNSVLSGIFLGLSFLSKYFLVFLVAGLTLYVLFKAQKKHIKNILVVLLVIVPFGLQNLYFNYNSCWNNILFNFFARTDNLEYNIKTLFGYLLILVYLFTPWGIYYLVKSKIKNNKLLTFILFTISVGFLVFLMTSMKKSIGLHWLLIFTPFMIMMFAFIKDEYRAKMIKYSLAFTYIHILLLLTIALLPSNLFESHKKYNDIVLFTQTQALCSSLNNIDNIYTTDYTSAAILSYHCKKDINMIMNNSKYGRASDKIIDIRDLQNQTINIFYTKKPKLEKLTTIFEDIEIMELSILNSTFFIAKANNLNYDKYKEIYLDIQKEKFYNIPPWLPKGECYFLDRYYK